MIQIASHLAEHLEPILALREELANRWTLAIDRPHARGRLAAGQVAFDPLEFPSVAYLKVGAFCRSAFDIRTLPWSG